MAEEKPYKIEPNIEAAISYIPFIAIAVLLMEKENKFVRFHAYQSVFFWIGAFALYSMASFLKFILIGFLLIPIINSGTTIMWFFLMWKAYNKKKPELPIIGRLAKEQAEK